MRTAATGTTIAGIRIPRLLDEDDLAAAVDVSEEASDVFAAEVAATLLGTSSETWSEESCAESVTGIVWTSLVVYVVTSCVTGSSTVRVIVVKAGFVPPSAIIPVPVAVGPLVPVGIEIRVVLSNCGSLFILCIFVRPEAPLSPNPSRRIVDSCHVGCRQQTRTAQERGCGTVDC